MINNILENREILNQLNWESFEEAITELSIFPNTILGDIFNVLKSNSSIKHSHKKTSEFLREDRYEEIESIRAFLSSLSTFNLQEIRTKIDKGAYLEILEINSIILLTEAYCKFISFFELSLDEKNNQREIFEFKKSIIGKFRSFVDTNGEINYFNHPELSNLINKIKRKDENLRKRVQEILNDNSLKHTFQIATYDIIDNRFVVPIKSDCYTYKFAKIIAKSDSAKTLYCEPYSIKSFNDERVSLSLELDNKINLLLREVLLEIRVRSSFVQKAHKSIKEFDLYYCRSRFAYKYNLNCPQIIEDKRLSYENLFHPLIQNPIRNNIEISQDKSIMSITGPNTGGKTAIIKALCISQIFLKCGLFVPAMSAEVFNFEKIYYFGNDQQSLQDGLSSFSAEVKSYAQLLESIEDSSLVIIDEIFNTTSSEEASALAIALFDEILNKNNCLIIVSTHHQTLKILMHQRVDTLSTHMIYDVTQERPTYKISLGEPGSSYALDIFKSIMPINIASNIYERAKRYISNKTIHYEKLLNTISQKEEKLKSLINENMQINKEIKNQKEATQGLLNLRLESEYKNYQKEYNKRLTIIDNLIEQLKSNKVNFNKKEINKKLDEFKTQENSLKLNNERNDVYSHLTKPKKLHINGKYFCTTIKKDITLLQTKNNFAIVANKNFKIKVPLSSLREPTQKSNNQKVYVNIQKSAVETLELYCVGMRVEEFGPLVEEYTYKVESTEIPYIIFIHGHGDGILKNWIRNFIKKSKNLMIDQGESTNDGQTRVILKTN